MRTLLLVVFQFSSLFLCCTTHAEAPQRWGMAAGVSTSGIGGDLWWRVNRHWSIALSYDRFRYSFDYDFSDYTVTFDTHTRLKFGNISASASYAFTGWLYGRVGIGYNDFSPEIYGTLHESVQYGDIQLSPETVGSMRVTTRPSWRIAPYAALGFGRFIPVHHRIAFSAEFGAWYWGKPEIRVDATKMLVPSTDADHIARLEHQVRNYRLFPIIRFRVSMGIFGNTKSARP